MTTNEQLCKLQPNWYLNIGDYWMHFRKLSLVTDHIYYICPVQQPDITKDPSASKVTCGKCRCDIYM